ncbi:MAG: glycosyltransferase family 2 protein [Lachnospiraceae bacterium]|nr:glycosyltransferase family 2 protein [Lachnospiraceae bacterium]
MIKYSVIIPVYNLENYITKTLDSLAGRPEDTEIIIVNDGSTDNSWTVMEEYISENDLTDIQLLKEANLGVSIARNTGIGAARGEYIVFIDGDDLCSDDMFAKIDKSADTLPDMIVWRFSTKDGSILKDSQRDFEKEEYTGAEFCKTLLSGENRIRIGSFVIRKRLIIDCNLRFTEGCAICEDVEFMYKAVISSKSVKTINDICYTYIKREGSAMNTSKKADMRKFQAPRAIQRIYGYVAMHCNDIVDDYIEDNLKYGLYITHCMHSFESCCRNITTGADRRAFLKEYYEKYTDIEDYIKKASKNMKYRPHIYSEKRLKLFLFNRRLYTWYICNRNKVQLWE